MDKIKKQELLEKWKKLTLSDNFIFTKVMRDKEICIEVLRRLLPHINIKDIKILEYEKVLDSSISAKGIRLDIYADDGETVYNLEMQSSNIDDLAKRSRFYQSQIDIECLSKGEKYYTLKNSFIIFLCTFDLFEKGLPLYTFTNKCHEDDTIALNDGVTKLFFNTTNHDLVSNKKMAEFLKYVNSKSNIDFQTEDKFIKKLVKEVELIKQNEEYEVEYMSLNATLDYAEQVGELKGKTEMVIEMLKLNIPMEDIIKISKLSESMIAKIQEQLSFDV